MRHRFARNALYASHPGMSGTPIQLTKNKRSRHGTGDKHKRTLILLHLVVRSCRGATYPLRACTIRLQDGTVLRITRDFRSMLDQFGHGSAMTEVDTMVKYGPVEIIPTFPPLRRRDQDLKAPRKGVVTDVSGPQRNACSGTLNLLRPTFTLNFIVDRPIRSRLHSLRMS